MRLNASLYDSSADSWGSLRHDPANPKFGHDKIEQFIVRLRIDRGDALGLKRHADCERSLAVGGPVRRQVAVIEASATTKPVAVAVERHEGHEQHVRLDPSFIASFRWHQDAKRAINEALTFDPLPEAHLALGQRLSRLGGALSTAAIFGHRQRDVMAMPAQVRNDGVKVGFAVIAEVAPNGRDALCGVATKRQRAQVVGNRSLGLGALCTGNCSASRLTVLTQHVTLTRRSRHGSQGYGCQIAQMRPETVVSEYIATCCGGR